MSVLEKLIVLTLLYYMGPFQNNIGTLVNRHLKALMTAHSTHAENQLSPTPSGQ